MNDEPTVPLSDLKELLWWFEQQSVSQENKPVDLEVYDGIGIGRKRSANELRDLIDDYSEVNDD